MAARDSAEELGRAIRKTQNVDSVVGKTGSFETILPEGNYEVLEIYVGRLVEENSLFGSNVLIWGDSTQGDWGTNVWGNIGTEPNMVYNDYNLFIETLSSDRFVNDTLTTGDVSTSIGSIYLDNNEVYVSSIVGYNPNYNIISGTVSILTTDYDLSDTSIYLSNDNGVTWEEYIENYGTPHLFSTTGKQLKIKLESNINGQYIQKDYNEVLFGVKYEFE